MLPDLARSSSYLNRAKGDGTRRTLEAKSVAT
jgi:molybdate-binding protein